MRRHLPQMVATGRMSARQWLATRTSGLGEAWLGLLLPVVAAALMFGATCGAPDVVRRGQAQPAGGGTGGAGGSSASGGATAGAGGTTTPPPEGGSSPASGGRSGGTSSAGGTSPSGGTIATGGRTGTGGTSAAGGRSATGGTAAGGTIAGGTIAGGTITGGTVAGGTRTGGTATGGVTSPFGGGGGAGGGSTGGRGGTGAGGTTGGSTGGTGGRGGTSGSGGATSTAPTGSLAVYVTQKPAGSTGQISLYLRIDNQTSASVDLSTVTLRYWYQDEGLGTTLVLAADYVSIGHSNLGTVAGFKVATASPAAAGADHYFEFSFTGTLAAKGDTASNDQFTVNVRLHTAGYTGTVDVTNDYSYNAGATGYDTKITLYGGGKLISGAEP